MNSFSHIPTSQEKILEISASIDRFISKSRLEHIFSVEKEALALARIYFPYLGIDRKYENDLRASSLLHDITKNSSNEQQMELCRKYGIDDPQASPAVLHARTGAFFAREYFSINDVVFSAIYNHTTAKENMNIFDKIIFIADYIESTRTHKDCKKARDFFYINIEKTSDKMSILDKTILISLDNTLLYLLQKGNTIDIQTIKARNFLLAECTLQ